MSINRIQIYLLLKLAQRNIIQKKEKFIQKNYL